MELDFFARFHVRAGEEPAAEAALAAVGPPTQAEAGCLAWRALRGVGDPCLFMVVSRWRDAASFEAHAGLPHTRRFLDAMTAIGDREAEFTRARTIL